MLALSGERSDLANCGFEGQQMFMADETAGESRMGTHGPRMGGRFIEGTVERHFTGVEADAGPGLAEAGAEVFFAGHEIDRAGLSVVREDEIHQRVFR